MKRIAALILTIMLLSSAFALAEEKQTCTHDGRQKHDVSWGISTASPIDHHSTNNCEADQYHYKTYDVDYIYVCDECWLAYEENCALGYETDFERYSETVTDKVRHTYNSNHVCTECGHTCEHHNHGNDCDVLLDYDIAGYQIYDMDIHKINYNVTEAIIKEFCDDCGAVTGSRTYDPLVGDPYYVYADTLPEYDEHHFVDNVCSECGYEQINGDPECVHSFVTTYSEAPLDVVLEYHWDCEDGEEHWAYYAYPLETVQKTYCRKCGYVDTYWTNYDNWMCNMVVEPHHFVNGVCACGCKDETAPTTEPTVAPTVEPTVEPTKAPAAEPTSEPTEVPTVAPTEEPTSEPTEVPTVAPTEVPTVEPTEEPTAAPTMPTVTDTPVEPTAEPSAVPSEAPKTEATKKPSSNKKTTESETKSEAVVTKTFRNDWAETVFNAEVNDALKALDEINPEAHESMLVLLAVMGFEDQVGDLLSEEALIVKAQMEESLAAMTDEEREKAMIEGFEYETIIVNDQTYSIPTFEWIVTENDIVTVEFYALRWNGTAWTLEQIEASEETVCAVQTALNALDYNCGEVDGICGPKTKAALMAFQKDNALLETGVPTHETLQKLRAMNCEAE